MRARRLCASVGAGDVRSIVDNDTGGGDGRHFAFLWVSARAEQAHLLYPYTYIHTYNSLQRVVSQRGSAAQDAARWRCRELCVMITLRVMRCSLMLARRRCCRCIVRRTRTSRRTIMVIIQNGFIVPCKHILNHICIYIKKSAKRTDAKTTWCLR